MGRGHKAKVGDERISPNGYAYVRTETEWRLKHHLVAEETLGRPLKVDERVRFRDGDRTNLNPSNIQVVLQGKSSLRRRKAVLEARIEELRSELAEVTKEMKAP